MDPVAHAAGVDRRGFATFAAGAIVVSVYQTNSLEECHYVLHYSGARAIPIACRGVELAGPRRALFAAKSGREHRTVKRADPVDREHPLQAARTAKRSVGPIYAGGCDPRRARSCLAPTLDCTRGARSGGETRLCCRHSRVRSASPQPSANRVGRRERLANLCHGVVVIVGKRPARWRMIV